MTAADLELLMSDRGRRAVEENLTEDPARVAMRLRKEFGESAAAIATQIKYLNRAKDKFPRLYEARCIIPPLAFEQASSSAVAATKRYSGGLCVDLTCGLGIDTMNFAANFDRVISIEQNSLLVEVVRYNLGLLGINNVEVVCGDAQTFIEGSVGHLRADMVYIDPARRDEKGRKVVGFEDCSPNVIALLPQIKRLASRLVIKCSPLFDVDEIFEIFGHNGVKAGVISSHNECKEVVADIDFENESARRIEVCSTEFGAMEFDLEQEEAGSFNDDFVPPYRYLLVPDVSLYKARMARRYLSSVSSDVFMNGQNGYGFSNIAPQDFFGRIFEIESIEPLQVKVLKRRFKEQNIRGITIMQRSGRLSNSQLMTSLGVVEGDQQLVAVTEIKRKDYVVFLTKK